MARRSADFRESGLLGRRLLGGGLGVWSRSSLLEPSWLVPSWPSPCRVAFVAVDLAAVFFAGAFAAGAFFAGAFVAGAFFAGAFLAACLRGRRLLRRRLRGGRLRAVAFARRGAFLAGAFAAGAFLAGAAFVAVGLLAAAFFAAAIPGTCGRLAKVSFGSFLAPEMTFFRSAPGLNFGTAVFLALSRSPVCGLRTHRAGRTRFSNEPNPVMATFSPRATSRVIVSRTDSRACAAALRFPW